MQKQPAFIVIALSILLSSLTSCHIAQKMDAHIASQFNNKVPKPDKRTDSTVIVNSAIPSDPNELSHTVKSNKNLFSLTYEHMIKKGSFLYTFIK